MRPATLRRRLSLVLLAWFAQLCLPVVHAAVMATPAAMLNGWCGDPARLLALVAAQPAEYADMLGVDELDKAGTHPLDNCAQLCATAFTPAPPPAVASVDALRAAGLAPVSEAVTAPPSQRAQSPTPPSQAPPARA